MEKIVRIAAQSPMRLTDWTKQSGETVTIHSVELWLTDGIDQFIAEANDSLADQLHAQPFAEGTVVSVQCRMTVSRWTGADNTERQATRVKLLKISAL